MNQFKIIDTALQIYYESTGDKNYTNTDGIGKFLEFCIENGLEEDDINDELSSDIDPSECVYVGFDDNFPLHENDNKTDDKETQIYNIIKYCYINRKPPNVES
eukprot:530906_1